MTPRTKKTAAALSGALVLASGAYALGTQTSDGTALAGGTPTPRPALPAGRPGGPGPRDLSDIAAKLGVTEAKLRAALEDLRPDRGGKGEVRKEALAKALATELGLDEAKVTAALEKFRGDRKVVRRERRGDRIQRFDDALAAKLGVDKAKVRAAFDALRPGKNRRADKPALADLAKQIGVSEAKLRAALADLRPGPRPGRPAAPASVTAAAAALAARPTWRRSPRSSGSRRPSCAPRCRRSAAISSRSTRPSATPSSPSWPPSSASPRRR